MRNAYFNLGAVFEIIGLKADGFINENGKCWVPVESNDKFINAENVVGMKGENVWQVKELGIGAWIEWSKFYDK